MKSYFVLEGKNSRKIKGAVVLLPKNSNSRKKSMFVSGNMPSFDDYMEQLESYGGIEEYTRVELEISTVLIVYAHWRAVEKANTIDDEFGDNIPDWRGSGYVRITSPVDTRIEMCLTMEMTHYVFYIEANKPLLVKMKTGYYIVTNVNNYGFGAYEDTLESNIYYVYDTNTADNPCEINLTTAVETYSIGGVDISNIPDYSSETLVEERATVEQLPQEAQKREKKGNKLIYIIIIVLTLGTTIIVAAVSGRKKKEEE